MFHVPNKYRVREHPMLGSDNTYGNNGVFIFKYIGIEVRCLASDGMGWEHVSVSLEKNESPSWRIMCYVKDLFWDKEDTVIQFHPAKSEYVKVHPYCLHLWRPIGVEIPKPKPEMIGKL